MESRIATWWFWVGMLLAVPYGLQDAMAEGGVPLHERVAETLERIDASPLDAPIAVDSTDDDSSLRGEIQAAVDESFGAVSEALGSAGNWCEIIFLHLNVKACVFEQRDSGASLRIYIGRKEFETPDDVMGLDLDFEVIEATEHRLEIGLHGDDGPHGTRDFAMDLTAVPIDGSHTLLEFRYSLGIGGATRLAMDIYLGTAGADRVGFSRDEDGELIGGLRGMIERNVMRFYLALQTFLETREVPESERLQARLERWFELTERYAEQLRELDRDTYLSQKAREREQQDAM
ncbi:hypothetical protein THITH_12670 [Thioalkalivibrio paradoxus ARh 1]|uniref:Uncharacterized protein n=2 Tax=Thioalkalivibrio paradoxus TaxID=108010 RepID=W0DNX8_9GAMM|nr:hypothetical protein THITH_12670 [Thioalkalivibrio paradoxus ARh 1]